MRLCYGVEGQVRLDCDIEDTLEKFLDENDSFDITYPIKIYEFTPDKLYVIEEYNIWCYKKTGKVFEYSEEEAKNIVKA